MRSCGAYITLLLGRALSVQAAGAQTRGGGGTGWRLWVTTGSRSSKWRHDGCWRRRHDGGRQQQRRNDGGRQQRRQRHSCPSTHRQQ
ncbi:hypothetical protein JKP88DRAFT_220968 [Tribonema minus]|uniref:Secreted protein n=1 Tax=Tribonema minus TaxID=303371 RepID=A0A835YW52_9STRA|nr:hypothetical protein JKP88DRAFT_220968 [Tribonema minus]